MPRAGACWSAAPEAVGAAAADDSLAVVVALAGAAGASEAIAVKSKRFTAGDVGVAGGAGGDPAQRRDGVGVVAAFFVFFETQLRR